MPVTLSDGKKYLTTREAAGIAQCGQDTVLRWRKRGKIRGVMTGTNRWLIEYESLMKHLGLPQSA